MRFVWSPIDPLITALYLLSKCLQGKLVWSKRPRFFSLCCTYKAIILRVISSGDMYHIWGHKYLNVFVVEHVHHALFPSASQPETGVWETGQWEDWDAETLCHGKCISHIYILVCETRSTAKNLFDLTLIFFSHFSVLWNVIRAEHRDAQAGRIFFFLFPWMSKRRSDWSSAALDSHTAPV